jgi:hypothetical protein
MGYRERMRRAAVWGTIGTMLVLPILACSGGDTTTDAAVVEPAPPPPPPSNEVTDPATTVQGTWKVYPSDEDLRQLKILNLALDTTSTEADLGKRLTPPPTADETKQYNDLKAAIKANPNDPSVKMAEDIIKMMKNTEMTVTGTEVTLSIDGNPSTWTYTVDSASTNNLQLTLSSNEKQSYVFEGPDMMRLTMGTPPNEYKLRFNRMGADGVGGKAGKGDGGGKAGKGGGGGGGGDGKAGKGKGGKGH